MVSEHAVFPRTVDGLSALPGPPTVAISLFVRPGHWHPSLISSPEIDTYCVMAASAIFASASDAARGKAASPTGSGHDARRHGGRPKPAQSGHPFVSSAWKMLTVTPTNETCDSYAALSEASISQRAQWSPKGVVGR